MVASSSCPTICQSLCGGIQCTNGGFHTYANQGFYKNEFLGLNFPNDQAGGPPTISGDEILRDIRQVEISYSKWVNLTILFGMVIQYRVLFLVIVKITKKVKPMIKALLVKPPEKSTHVMEQPPAEPQTIL